jgi:hypothetical protein
LFLQRMWFVSSDSSWFLPRIWYWSTARKLSHKDNF